MLTVLALSFCRVPQNAEVFARIELIDFVNESEMEALLMMPADLRNKVKKIFCIPAQSSCS
jgi:hypothetical protein